MTVTTEADERPFLKIIFDGVVAVGPGRPAEGDEQPGPFFGVMPRSTRRLSDRTQRLRRERKAAAAHGIMSEEPDETPYYVHMHVPTIFTRLKPAHDSRPPDQIFYLSPFHDPWYIWHPLRERLEFRVDDDGTPGPLTYPKGEALTFSSEHGQYLHEDELSFHGIEHVPDLSEIWPERSVLRDGLLSWDAEVDERVVTQVLVPCGEVVSAGPLERRTPRKVDFEPVRKLPNHDALLPNAAIVVRGTTLEIASYSLDTGEPLDSIKFDAPNGAEIWVSNGDPSDAEFDMKQLSIEILKRLLQKGEWKPSPEVEECFEKDFGLFFAGIDRFDRTSGADFAMLFAAFVNRMIQMRPHHHEGPLGARATTLHRTGAFDLDFELFYTLMKDERPSEDGLGLPVPKHVDVEAGPDCYPCTCRTNDRLELKSNRGR